MSQVSDFCKKKSQKTMEKEPKYKEEKGFGNFSQISFIINNNKKRQKEDRQL